MFNDIWVGFKTWLGPAPGAIQGSILPQEKDQAFRLALVAYMLSLAGVRWVFNLIGMEPLGAVWPPSISLVVAALTYTFLYLYRLGQGVPSASLRPRILMIEDDQQTTQAMLRLLRAGWDIVLVDSVSMALRRINEGYDWILVDIILPGESGHTILQEVRAKKIKTKIAVITGLSAGPTYDAIKELEPDMLMTKPLDVELFLSKLRSV